MGKGTSGSRRAKDGPEDGIDDFNVQCDYLMRTLRPIREHNNLRIKLNQKKVKIKKLKNELRTNRVENQQLSKDLTDKLEQLQKLNTELNAKLMEILQDRDEL